MESSGGSGGDHNHDNLVLYNLGLDYYKSAEKLE